MGIRFTSISIQTCRRERTSVSGHLLALPHSLGIPARANTALHRYFCIHDLEVSSEGTHKAAEGLPCLPLTAWRASTRKVDYHPRELSCCLFGHKIMESNSKHLDRSQICLFLGEEETCFSICFMAFMHDALWKALESCCWDRPEALGRFLLFCIFAFLLILLFWGLCFPTERKTQDGCPCRLIQHLLLFLFYFVLLFCCYLFWSMMNQVSDYKSCKCIAHFLVWEKKFYPSLQIPSFHLVSPINSQGTHPVGLKKKSSNYLSLCSNLKFSAFFLEISYRISGWFLIKHTLRVKESQNYDLFPKRQMNI